MVMIAYQVIIILMAVVSIDMPTNLPLFKQPPKFETVLYNTNKIKSLQSPLQSYRYAYIHIRVVDKSLAHTT